MLKNLARSNDSRLAILGIGNELLGDDSAGIRFVEMLQQASSDRPNLFIFNCGAVPENATGPLRKFVPDFILMVDAAEMYETPGSINWIDLSTVSGFSASSHTLPLSILAKYLRSEFTCEVGLLCVQPQSLEFGEGLSKPVATAVHDILSEIIQIFDQFQQGIL